jgi:hypothetical protein
LSPIGRGLSVADVTLRPPRRAFDDLGGHVRRRAADNAATTVARGNFLMSDQQDNEGSAAGLLEQLQRRLSDRGLKRTPLFRVVEVMRGPDGRLSRQGQIWHGDLSHARRFGRVLAANSASHEVLVADVNGGVIEQFATVGAERPPLGWGDGWRNLPLPPAPPARRPNAALRRAPPPPSPPPPAKAVPAVPPALAEVVDVPLQAVEAAVGAAPAVPAPTEPPRPTPAPAPPEAADEGLATPLAGEIGLTLP